MTLTRRQEIVYILLKISTAPTTLDTNILYNSTSQSEIEAHVDGHPWKPGFEPVALGLLAELYTLL